MPEPEQRRPQPARCAQCGAELRSQTAGGLCPRCLLEQAMGAPHPQTVVVSPLPNSPQDLVGPGEQLGHYRIVRRLGGGGMGIVFEAEDLESGRRVALKLLSQQLDSPEARERFFREGRLAASINHPNSVYVFGTEEIGGIPAIAMEFVAGGTLEERVRAQGPLAPAAAVDAVLQIIAGLDAAQRIGILHRDIKPSNCFVDADGAVKIGDFGLSISTTIRTEPALTATGSILGTPAFCSPEQLRGEALDVQSDIYSVGVTLFYLLTGRTPIEGKNAVALIASVLEQPIPSPRQFRPDLPKGLAQVTLRCLEKQAGARYRTYDDLRQALAPFSSTTPVPAKLSVRFLAGVLDLVLVSTGCTAVMMLASFNPMDFLEHGPVRPWLAYGFLFGGVASTLLYYGVLEGIRGATLGKSICGLRVTGPNRQPPGLGRGLVRALLYGVLPALPMWATFGGNIQSALAVSRTGQMLMGFSYYGMLALLFCTARCRNGFAAVHDWLTGCRVVARATLQPRPAFALQEAAPEAVETRRMLGPYHVLETIEESPEQTWLLCFDLRLLRKVWVRVVPPGTPPVPAPGRNLNRATRLRWLTGRRSVNENWDAFEAVRGEPLSCLLRRPQAWGLVRFWLDDLVRELQAAEKDGTLPAQLEFDRVWITPEGRAKLLDFPAPRSRAPGQTAAPVVPVSAPPVVSPVRFLATVATAALAGRPEASGQDANLIARPLPLHVREFLKDLARCGGLAAVMQALSPLLHKPALVTRWRRAIVVGACVALPLFSIVTTSLGWVMLDQWARRNPGVIELSMVLQQRWALRLVGNKGPTDRQYAVYIASHFQSVVTNPPAWSGPVALMLIKGEDRQFAERSVTEHPAPTAEEIQEATAAVQPGLPSAPMPDLARQPDFPLIAAFGALLVYVCVPAMVAALLFRGGLALRLAGIAFVRRDGAPASRLRVFWRAMVAWSPALPVTILMMVLMQRHAYGWELLVTGAYVVLVALSLALRDRGLPDRLAGTWPVLR